MGNKIYNLLCQLKDNCNLDSAFFYVKVGFIQAPLEVALSLFIVESIMIYTPFFHDGLEPKDTILMILIPLISATFVCLFYTLGITRKYLRSIRYCIDNYIGKTDMNANEKYDSVNQYMVKAFKAIHITGFICYAVTGLFIAYLFSYSNLFSVITENRNLLFLIQTFMGILLGGVWNLLGYNCDKTVDWRKVFYLFNDNKLISMDMSKKFNYFLIYSILNALTIIMSLGVFSFITLEFNSAYNVGNFSELNIVTYAFFAISFIAVLLFYIKIIFSLHYIEGAKKYYLGFKEYFEKVENELK